MQTRRRRRWWWWIAQKFSITVRFFLRVLFFCFFFFLSPSPESGPMAATSRRRNEIFLAFVRVERRGSMKQPSGGKKYSTPVRKVASATIYAKRFTDWYASWMLMMKRDMLIDEKHHRRIWKGFEWKYSGSLCWWKRYSEVCEFKRWAMTSIDLTVIRTACVL